jgi:hypothetical protein
MCAPFFGTRTHAHSVSFHSTMAMRINKKTNMKALRLRISALLVLGFIVSHSEAFVSVLASNARSVRQLASPGNDDEPSLSSPGGFMKGVSNFFAELDAFVDDATARRLGNGAAFYGKRKSSFYGSKDKMKKSDRDAPDPTEDYQGPTTAGYFKWMPTDDGTFFYAIDVS